MDWYTGLDVTEKTLSVLVAILALASVLQASVLSTLRKFRPKLASSAFPRERVIIVTLFLLAAILLTWVAYRSGKNASVRNVQAIRQIIEAEAEVIVETDLDILDSIYAADAIVIHCPAPVEMPDVIHEGRERIRERYAKFMSLGWKSVSQVDLSITVVGNKATAVSQGIVVNAEDFIKFTSRFTLEKENNQWVITRFECGL